MSLWENISSAIFPMCLAKEFDKKNRQHSPLFMEQVCDIIFFFTNIVNLYIQTSLFDLIDFYNKIWV